jgi:OPA family sugar phosphate sensor protein UhpC-like MFS transporter
MTINWRTKVLVSTYFSYAGYYITRKGYGVLKKPIGDEFGLDASALAHIWTAFLVAYTLGQFLNGALGRRSGPRILLLTGMAISLGCNIAFGFANSYATFLGFMVLNGLAQASGWPAVLGTAAQWVKPKERGTLLGVLSTNYVIGNIGVKLLVSFVWTYAGWRTAFWACSLVMAGFWLLVLMWQRNRPEDVGLPPIVQEAGEAEPAEEKPEFRQMLHIAMRPAVLGMGITYFSYKFLRYALDSWLPYFLATGKNAVTVATAGYYSTIFDWAGFAGILAAGWMMDRLFHGRWQMLCLILTVAMVLCYGLILLEGGSHPLLLACLYGAVGFLIYGPDSIIPGAAAVSVAGEREAVLAAGVINGIGSIGPIVQEEVIGFMFSRYQNVQYINSLYFVLSGCAMVFLLLLMYSQRNAKA